MDMGERWWERLKSTGAPTWKRIERVLVTVPLAEAFLDLNTRNRRMTHRVKTYRHDIESGCWFYTPDPIIVTDAGVLGNGQHRCQAVVESGVPILADVVFNFPHAQMLNIDGGKERSVADRLRIDSTFSGDSSKLAVSIAKLMLKFGVTGGAYAWQPAASEVAEFLLTHREAVEFAMSQFPTAIRGISVSPVMAAVMVAYSHEDHGKLAQFCGILRGDAEASQAECGVGARTTAERFARWLVGSSLNTRKGPVRASMYRVAQRAIMAFCSDECLVMFRVPGKNIYQLPNQA